jgi:L-lactate dehydrogenase complex protein LldF
MSGMSPRHFRQNAIEALADLDLQRALGNMRRGFIERRRQAAERLPEFEALRDKAREIKTHVLGHLDVYLEIFEKNVVANGGTVHWASDPAQARDIILNICRLVGAETVTKGKSMVGEEIAINPFLEEKGIRPIETDLGEYIIQLRNEPPSHIIAPAIHVNKEQVADAFRKHHRDLAPERPLDDRAALLAEARRALRERFLDADVGITGANFLVAETGSTIIVTNEGNGDLTQTLPRIHIVLAGIEKVVPTLDDAATLFRVLARSATGQEMSVYTTISTGPKRKDDPDGPEQYHVVLLDNGRSALIGGEFQEVLGCIRCGACLNHCPVYGAVGGHAYGSVYPGPIGKVLTPALAGLEEARDLPNASTFCGRCEEVCPVRIPLPKLMRHWRAREFEQRMIAPRLRWALKLWSFAASVPWMYHFGARLAALWLYRRGKGGRGRIAALPYGESWTQFRDFPAPQRARTFQSLWHGPRRHRRASSPSQAEAPAKAGAPADGDGPGR